MGVRNARVRGLFISDRDSEFYLRLKPVARRKNMICLRQIFGRLDTLGSEIHSLVRKVTRENKFYLMIKIKLELPRHLQDFMLSVVLRY